MAVIPIGKTEKGRGLMLNKKNWTIAALAAASWVPLSAQAGTSQLDLYYVDAEVDAQPGGGADGDGFGLKGRFALGEDGGFLSYEYQDAEVDPGSDAFGFLRVGFGGTKQISPAFDLLMGLEVIRADLGGETESGFGIKVGVETELLHKLTATAALGYVNLGLDAGEGPESTIGLRYGITPRVSLFADYRVHDLNGGPLDELIFTETRVGFGLRFGKASKSSKPRPAPVAAAPAPVAAAKPMPAPAPAPKAPTQPVDPLDGVMTAVFDWARAWSAQDVERYLAAYAPEFTPSGGLSRSAWIKQRRQRVAAPSRISVEVIEPKAESTGMNMARVRFKQVYESNTYSDTTNKVLELKQVAGRWLIVRETSR